MDNCPVCSRVITANGRPIICSVCSLVYHSECAGICKRTFKNFCREALNIWECSSCQNVVYRQRAERYRGMLDMMGKYSTDHSEARTAICGNIASLVKSSNLNLKHMLNNYQLLVDTEKEILTEFTIREKEMGDMEKEIEYLKCTVDNMNNPAPEGMVTKICIGCISEDDPYDVLKIAKKTAEAIRVNFDEKKIISACFFEQIDFKVTRSVCLQFSDPEVCNEWVQKYQQVVRLAPKATVKMINYDLLKKAAVEDMGFTIPEGVEVVVAEEDVCNHYYESIV